MGDWLQLSDTVINMDLVTHLNLYLGRDKPMVQVCYASHDDFTNLEQPEDIWAMLAWVKTHCHAPSKGGAHSN